MIKIDCYSNSRYDCVSIRSREPEDYGDVIAHRKKVTVVDPTFVIQESGQEACRETGVENVHALVRGFWNDHDEVKFGTRVTYNPFENDYFVIADGGRPVSSAEIATVMKNSILAKGVETVK